MEISKKIRENFSKLSTFQDRKRSSLFAGRDLPAFMQAYLLMRFTIADTGVIDEDGLNDYLSTKMTNDGGLIRKKLLSGEKVNITCRFYVKSDLQEGMTAFTISDIEFGSNAYILQSIVDENKDSLCDGENWGNITIEYVEPDGKRKGYVNMISYRPFRPISVVDLDYFAKARTAFSLQEWIDAIVASMGYNPEAFSCGDEEETMKKKQEFISRLLIAIEPRMNLIELGPKGTGKSYCYNNNSKYLWLHVNGGTTRAEMFYNRLTKQYGPLKTHDGLGIDEVTTFDIKDNEVRSMLKGYLEAGKAAIGKVTFSSNCGICLLGNIPLSETLRPYDTDYYRFLPGIFRESALMDRFHGFIQGWKIPRLSVGSIYEGWTINMEYLSEILHLLRTCPEYGKLFDEIVSYDASADLRDVKAVKKIATAYAKLLFPHVKSLEGMADADKQEYIESYEKYCLVPAIEKRGIIRMQCHLLDKEYQPEMPQFHVSSPNETTIKNNEGNTPGSTLSDKDSQEPDGTEDSIMVHSLFLSEGEFVEGKKEHLFESVENVCRWLETQASTYGRRLKLIPTYNDAGPDSKGQIPTIYAETPKDIDCNNCSGTDANFYLGLDNKNHDWLMHAKDSIHCDKAILLVFVDADGRSFSGWNGPDSEFAGTAILYGGVENELQTGVIAHEIMHLLGAKDLYGPYQSDDVARFIEENYPNEIMFQDNSPVEQLSFCPYTLWKIGWTTETEDWFDSIA